MFFRNVKSFIWEKRFKLKINFFSKIFEKLLDKREKNNLPQSLQKTIENLRFTAEKYINYYDIPVVFSKEDKEPILHYTSEYIIPDKKIDIYFQLDFCGINLIIPDFRMFVLIPEKDLELIYSFLEYLETNIYYIIKYVKDTKNQAISDNQMKAEMEINNQDRSNILNSL